MAYLFKNLKQSAQSSSCIHQRGHFDLQSASECKCRQDCSNAVSWVCITVQAYAGRINGLKRLCNHNANLA